MAYAAFSVVFGEQPSAAKWNILGTNDASFNDGSGLPTANSVSATVNTSETTTSTSYVSLATTTDSVSATIGSSGKALVTIGCWMQCSLASGNAVRMTFVASGANTIAAGTAPYVILYQTWTTNAFDERGRSWLITGLTPGSTTFAAKYLTDGGTGTFKERNIAVVTF